MFKLLVASLATASALQLKRQPAAKPLSNALKLRGGLDLTDLDTAGLFGAMYYGGFGVTLLANPEFFYGADGLVPYFKASPGPVGTFFGRAFGACMTGMAALNFLEGADKATMLKAMAIGGFSTDRSAPSLPTACAAHVPRLPLFPARRSGHLADAE